MNNADQLKIRLTIKKLLKNRGATYADLAKHLGLTVAGFKRLMTKGNLSIARLSEISKWFELSLFEFISISIGVRPEQSKLTFEQASLLAANVQTLYIYLRALEEPIFCEELASLPKSIPKTMVEKAISDLIAARFLVRSQSGKLRCRVPLYQIWEHPRLQQKYKAILLTSISRQISADDESFLTQPFEMQLSHESIEGFCIEANLLLRKFQERSAIEAEIFDSRSLNKLKGIFFLGSGSITHEILKVPDEANRGPSAEEAPPRI